MRCRRPASCATRSPSGHQTHASARVEGAIVSRYSLRWRLRLHLFDESGAAPQGTAIYSLADPRAVRVSRYIGQTAQPRRRLLQRERRLPMMVVHDWVEAPQAHAAERARILACLEQRLPLLNVAICQMSCAD